MERTVEVIISSKTWPGGRPPKEISRMEGERKVDVRGALIHTALWTRPPVRYGFDLSDYWAWLRYGRAIANSGDLRLREEWTAVDSHQKAVLSDDMGVGFTTQLLIEKLGCRQFAETRYTLNVLRPDLGSLRTRSRRGPSKAPDYIGFGENGELYVLECKGSQSSPDALREAIGRGQQQKRNVRLTRSKITHSLVAGLFIPQWENPCSASMIIADPPMGAIDHLLEGYSAGQILTAIVRVSLAKHLTLLGLIEIPRFLLSASTEQSVGMPEAARREATIRRGERGAESRRITFDASELPWGDESDSRPRGRATIEAPEEIFERLTAENEDIGTIIEGFVASSMEHEWRGQMNSLVSPLGFHLTVEL